MDNSLMDEGCLRFTKEAECREAALICKPIYYMGDGGNSPYARLIITAYDDQDQALPTTEVRGTFELENDIRVQALVYSGQPRIDIRKWSTGYPTKKGISLSPQRWVSLLWSHKRLAGLIKDVKEGRRVDRRLHISGSVFASIASPRWTINIREWYLKDGSEKPGWKGIILQFRQWEQLLALEDKVITCMAEVRDVEPSCLDHHNLEEALHCGECFPSGSSDS